MKKIAIYPGSFDPITNGHIDIAKRALTLFDTVVVGIAINSTKQTLFTKEERLELIRNSLGDWDRIEIQSFEGLTVEFAQKIGANAIVRGLRAVSDFDYEYAISLVNKKLAPDVETVFLMASNDYSFVSSTIVKEVARHGREVSMQVPDVVSKALIKKYKDKAK
jgi:pantetheine-phosphate adenylyltransferase